MECALTQDLNLDCRDSYGGLKTVYLIEHEHIVDNITSAAGVITEIDKPTGKVFRKYNLIAHTGESDESVASSRENGSTEVTQTVKFPINKMNVSVRNELLLLGKNRLAIVIVDENGTGWLYGEEYGLMLNAIAAKTGVQLADRNGYELTFDGKEKTLAKQVDAATLNTLQTAGV